MKWWILVLIILLLLPFYTFVMSKSAMMGKIDAIRYLNLLLKHESKEETNGQEKK